MVQRHTEMKHSVRRHVVVVAMLTGVMTLASGCSNSGSDLTLDSGDYKWSIFMSEYLNTGFFPKNFSGYVALVRTDGSYDLIEHAGMDQGRISWTEHGINFADEDGDHWITERGNNIVEQDRVKLMDGLVTLSDGVTRVGVYNGGFQEDGYREGVVVSRPGSSEYHELTTVGFAPLVSACDDDVYTGYAMTPEDGGARFIFDQIVEDGSVDHTNISTVKVPFSEFGFIAHDAPCYEEHIYFLGGFVNYSKEQQADDERIARHTQLTSGGDDHLSVLASVNTSSGEMDWVTLTSEDGETLDLSPEDANYSSFDADSLDNDGNFVWMGGNGTLYRTKITTGETTILNAELKKTLDPNARERLYHFSSDDDTATVLVENTEDPLAQPRIVVFDKITGKIVDDVQINGLKDDVPSSMILRDIAQKPV